MLPNSIMLIKECCETVVKFEYILSRIQCRLVCAVYNIRLRKWICSVEVFQTDGHSEDPMTNRS